MERGREERWERWGEAEGEGEEEGRNRRKGNSRGGGEEREGKLIRLHQAGFDPQHPPGIE